MSAKEATRPPTGSRKPTPPPAPPPKVGRLRLELEAEREAKELAEARLRALGSVRVHWGWGADENRHTYCCLYRGRSLRSESLVELADAILRLERIPDFLVASVEL